MNHQARFGLKEKTIVAIGSVFLNYPDIEKVIIYGSRAMGSCREGSDIDLTLVAPSLSAESFMRIVDEIDDLMLPYKVDLSLFHHIDNQNLIDHIHRVGKPFWP
jgi:predicted nucleotidyltransferase